MGFIGTLQNSRVGKFVNVGAAALLLLLTASTMMTATTTTTMTGTTTTLPPLPPAAAVAMTGKTSSCVIASLHFRICFLF